MRTRSAAAELAGSGHVRLNGERVSAASRIVKAGDVLTLALDSRVRVMKVLGFAERRGSAAATAPLFEEVGRPPTAAAAPPLSLREPGAGRPTKRERREIDRLHLYDDE